jgi:hypothetical protein
MRRRRVARRIGIALMVLGVASVLYGFTGYLSTGHTAQRQDCDAPLPREEAARIDPDQPPLVDIAPFPFALTCTWIREDGSVYTQRWDRWGTTLFLYGGALVGVAGLALQLTRVERRPQA